MLLRAGADPHLCNGRGVSPLHLAARRDLPSVAAMLLGMGVHPNPVMNVSGKAPIHEAVLFGAYDTLAVLLNRGADGQSAVASAAGSPTCRVTRDFCCALQ